MRLFFDTETTGLVNFKLPTDDPAQPRLVQLGAILTNDYGKEILSFNSVIRPDGFDIPEQASNVHGITTEIAQKNGEDINHILHIFCTMASYAKIIIGHNISFDKAIMSGEFSRNWIISPFEDNEIEYFCTMQESTKILKMPKKTGGYKWPKLQEVYKFAFGEEFEGAHDAMADVRATKRVYEWLLTQ